MLKLKEKECEKRGFPFDGQLHAWDTRYFMTQVKKKKNSLFDLMVALKKLFRIFRSDAFSCLLFLRWRRPSMLLTRTS